MSLFQGHITCKNLTLLKFIQKILKAVLMKINFMSKTSLTNTKSKNSETSVVERLTKGQFPPKGTSLVGELPKVFLKNVGVTMINNTKVKNMDPCY